MTGVLKVDSTKVESTLTQICELVDQWKYAPVTLTSRYEQLELEMATTPADMIRRNLKKEKAGANRLSINQDD